MPNNLRPNNQPEAAVKCTTSIALLTYLAGLVDIKIAFMSCIVGYVAIKVYLTTLDDKNQTINDTPAKNRPIAFFDIDDPEEEKLLSDNMQPPHH